MCGCVCVCVCVRALLAPPQSTFCDPPEAIETFENQQAFFKKKLKKTQALEHAESVLQKKLSNFEKKIRKAAARKRKILDQLLTLEGYWSGVIPWPYAQLKKNPFFLIARFWALMLDLILQNL